MSGFTEEQLAALTAPLARDHIKQREIAGRKVSYIEGWQVVDEANRIFGFDAWDRETLELRCVAERETKIGPQGKDGWRVAYICKVRIMVRTEVSNVLREGTGYGSGIDVDLGAAHESAAKEAETDATKRALMTFGNPFGLALYDKEQANVEPPQRPAAKLPPAYPSREPADAKSVADLAKRVVENAKARQVPATRAPEPDPPSIEEQLTLSQIRDKITQDLIEAKQPNRPEGILRFHQRDLDAFLAAGNPGIATYNNLIILARDRAAALGGSLDDWELAG